MAQITVRITSQGVPVVGAWIYALHSGGSVKEQTDAQGEVTKTVPAGWGPEPVGIVVKSDDSQSGGLYLLEADTPLVIEL